MPAYAKQFREQHKFSFIGGGSLDDIGLAITTDLHGDQYVTGVTWSANLPVTPGVLSPSSVGAALLGPFDAFVHKFH
jgi:hypothetical protein